MSSVIYPEKGQIVSHLYRSHLEKIKVKKSNTIEKDREKSVHLLMKWL